MPVSLKARSLAHVPGLQEILGPRNQDHAQTESWQKAVVSLLELYSHYQKWVVFENPGVFTLGQVKMRIGLSIVMCNL